MLTDNVTCLPIHSNTSTLLFTLFCMYLFGLQAVLFTDNVSFLHIRNYTNPPFGLVEARSVTLIAPEGARINNIPLGVLRAMQKPGDSNSKAAAAAKGDGAGIVAVTDSYILGATNATLLPLLQRLGGQETQQPLLVLIQSNVTLAAAAWGDAWPEGGLKILRPTIWAGSSWQATSIDFRMEVGQVSPCLYAAMFTSLWAFLRGSMGLVVANAGVVGRSWPSTSIDCTTLRG
jgi:hypothetical protein